MTTSRMAPTKTSKSDLPVVSTAADTSTMTATTPATKRKTHVVFLDAPTFSFGIMLYMSKLSVNNDGLMKSIKESARSVPKYTGLTATLAVVAGVSMRRFGIYRGAEWEGDVLSCAPYVAILGATSSRRVTARTALHFLGFGITVFAADVAFKHYSEMYPLAVSAADDDNGLGSREDN